MTKVRREGQEWKTALQLKTQGKKLVEMFKFCVTKPAIFASLSFSQSYEKSLRTFKLLEENIEKYLRNLRVGKNL